MFKSKNQIILIVAFIILISATSCDGIFKSEDPVWQIAETDFGGTAIWGTAEDDIWVVDDNSPMHHWDGTTWTAFDVPSESPSNKLYAIWGSAPDNYWAGGEIPGGLLHWDGTQWNFVPVPNPFPATDFNNFAIYDIWGSSADDVWAVGEAGKVLHWKGAGWKVDYLPHYDDTLASETYYGISGSSSNEIWMVGTNLTMVYWDGHVWSRYVFNQEINAYFGGKPTIRGISFVRNEAGYNYGIAVGDSGLYLNYWDDWMEGGWQYVDWSHDRLYQIDLETIGIAGDFNSFDFWTAGRGYDGDLFHTQGDGGVSEAINNPANPRPLRGIWGSAWDNVWAVGDDIILHYDYVYFPIQ